MATNLKGGEKGLIGRATNKKNFFCCFPEKGNRLRVPSSLEQEFQSSAPFPREENMVLMVDGSSEHVAHL